MGYIRHAAQGQVDRRMTPALFGDLMAEHQADPTSACFFFDDFLGYHTLVTTEFFGIGQYYGFTENSGTAANVATEVDGVLRLSTGTTADNAIGFTPGHIAGMCEIGVGVPGALTGNGGKVAFEARLRFPDITDGDGSVYCGLMDVGQAGNSTSATTGCIQDSHAIATVDHLGFSVLDSDNSNVNFDYNVGSGTLQEVGDSDTIASASTWYKYGFIYDPSAETSRRIQWYVDGDVQGTYITKANIDASTFPGGEEMSPYLFAKTDASAAMRVDIDWWALAWQPTSIWP
jgi:hypothetical protein